MTLLFAGIFLLFSTKNIVSKPNPVIDVVVSSKNTVFSDVKINVEILQGYLDCDRLKSHGADYSETKQSFGKIVYKTSGIDNSTKFCEKIIPAKVQCKKNKCHFSEIKDYYTSSFKFAVSSSELNEIVLTQILQQQQTYNLFKIDISENNGQLVANAVSNTPFWLKGWTWAILVGILTIFFFKYILSLIIIEKQLPLVPVAYLTSSIIFYGLYYLFIFSLGQIIGSGGGVDIAIGVFLWSSLFASLISSLIESVLVIKIAKTRTTSVILLFFFSFIINILASLLGQPPFTLLGDKIVSLLI